MPKKIICDMSTEELKKAYIDEGRTLDEMCNIVGVKSVITVRKILNERGISTNNNDRLKQRSMNNMSEKEFEEYLRTEYQKGRSINDISTEFNISASGLRKYFVKYGIKRRSNTDFMKNNPVANPNWRGGIHLHEGYITVYCPEHPNTMKGKCIYEHQLVMEKHIGRYLKKGEVVHHIDGNKSNNNINNLMLLTQSDHTKLHAILRRSKKLMGEK